MSPETVSRFSVIARDQGFPSPWYVHTSLLGEKCEGETGLQRLCQERGGTRVTDSDSLGIGQDPLAGPGRTEGECCTNKGVLLQSDMSPVQVVLAAATVRDHTVSPSCAARLDIPGPTFCWCYCFYQSSGPSRPRFSALTSALSHSACWMCHQPNEGGERWRKES
ncbi:hypothetical protein RRG08_044446 [Elysia crispata]|uniref:Uncharacterized protein n=1 Tax=Elysia crispata TaxID=231223 RepID=A0AAE1CRT0_9GAST|nr:hypothetical protein RRG08_044446 [Elysia crispata]